MSKRVLLLEDHNGARAALGRLLTDAGFEVTACGTAEEAQVATELCEPDIAILDVRLPGRFGDDYGRELARKYARVKVIFLTGEVLLEHLKAYVPRATILSKPADILALLRLMVAS